MNRTPLEVSLYETLEISPRASHAVVRAAYRCLVQVWHPDKNPNVPAAAPRLYALNHAYTVLSDPLQRSLYDRKQAQRQADRRGVRSVPIATASTATPASATSNARRFAFRPLNGVDSAV